MMVDDYENSHEYSDDHLSEEDDESDLDLVEGLDDSAENATLVRPGIVDKVFATLSADAQRGDGELQRGDVNSVYLRKQLSIAECMAVEERIIDAGYRIFGDEDTDNQGFAAQRPMYRFLNESEEKELGRRIQLALRLPQDTSALDPVYVDRLCKDAERAKATFVASNIRYVEQLARRMGPKKHLSLEDIMQEGFIGLLRATDLYDPERGFRFKTYATWWIEQRMRRAIADGDRTIRLPVHIQEKMSQIRRSRAKLTLTRGHPPTLDELAAAVGIAPERLMKLLWRVHATDCAEGDESMGDDTTLLSLVADASESAFDVVLYQELQERFRGILATLTPREARILRMRFGIELDRDYTLESVGQQYNLTRERIRQIEAKALKKLRHPNRLDQLSDFLDS